MTEQVADAGGDAPVRNAERKPVPNDPYHIVYIIFYWLGMGSLLPWNFFISVTDYWMFKFRNVTADPFPPYLTSDLEPNMTSDLDLTMTFPGNLTLNATDINAVKMTDLQISWNSYLSIASMIPNVLFLKLNAVFGHHLPMQPRLVTANVVIMMMCVFTAVMAEVNTDTWQDTFLYVTLASVVVINVMVAIYQGGLSGVAAFFPPKYMGSVVQGQALGGIFAAATNVLCLVFGANSRKAAFVCFVINTGFLALSLIAYVLIHRTEFFKYYFDGHAHETSAPPSDEPENDALLPDAPEVKLPEKINVLQISKIIWVWILAVFLTFMVTLACFPAITSLVQSTNRGKGSVWSDKYFIPVGCFLLYNIGDYLGRILAGFLQWPKGNTAGGWIVLAMAIVRIAFLPLFLFCNASPKNRFYTQVYFANDWVFMVLMALFSISCGYIGSICMMFAPKMLPSGQAQSTAASIMVSFLVLGLAVGAGLSGCTILLL